MAVRRNRSESVVADVLSLPSDSPFEEALASAGYRAADDGARTMYDDGYESDEAFDDMSDDPIVPAYFEGAYDVVEDTIYSEVAEFEAIDMMPAGMHEELADKTAMRYRGRSLPTSASTPTLRMRTQRL